LQCTTISSDFSQSNFIPFVFRSRSRKFWKGRSWSRSLIFYLRLRNLGGFLPECPQTCRKKFWVTDCANFFSLKTVFGMTSKGLYVIWGFGYRVGAVFSNQSRLGAIFASIFREFAFIYKDFVKVFTDFPQISTDIVPILRDLAQIFTRSKLLGVRLHPCISVCYITDSLTFVPTVLNLFFVCLHARKSLKSQ